MKHTIEFKLPHDKFDFDACMHATQFYGQLFDIQNYIKSKLKHAEISQETQDILVEIRNIIDLYDM